jgi:hypothetical protein
MRDARAGMSRAGLAGFLLLASVLSYVLVESFMLEATTCEVCMRYRGRDQCRTVGASTVEEARTGAITNACAFLSSGVTDSMACQRETPVSESCK